jgi:hypothetical protein
LNPCFANCLAVIFVSARIVVRVAIIVAVATSPTPAATEPGAAATRAEQHPTLLDDGHQRRGCTRR